MGDSWIDFLTDGNQFRSVQDLQWYFEMNINGNVTGKADAVANKNLSPVYFETTTGITWYLPSFTGDDIQ